MKSNPVLSGFKDFGGVIFNYPLALISVMK